MRVSARCSTTILIVDDDAALWEGIAETVIDLGYAAVTAGNGLAALEALSLQRVDAVLLDLAANAAALLLSHPSPGTSASCRTRCSGSRRWCAVWFPLPGDRKSGAGLARGRSGRCDRADGDCDDPARVGAAGGNRAEAARRLGLEASAIETRGVSNRDVGSVP